MPNYYKREWPELRGDEYDSWGTSIWYFETDSDGLPLKQIEVYQNGNVCWYDNEKPHDDYGMLGDHMLDLEEFAEFEIPPQEFMSTWNSIDKKSK
jgi:hypothetical protein